MEKRQYYGGLPQFMGGYPQGGQGMMGAYGAYPQQHPGGYPQSGYPQTGYSHQYHHHHHHTAGYPQMPTYSHQMYPQMGGQQMMGGYPQSFGRNSEKK